ncbi:MAG: hypothetical protein PHT12_05685 [Patescibacteria group bacterium]|nr:hypothetical protein [Patescibacteria group bacterium]
MPTQPEQKCCDPFDPAPWQDKEITWQDKLFLKDHVCSFFHIPLNFGQVVTRAMKKIEAAGAKAEQLMPVDEKSLWGADLYIPIAKEVPGATNVRMSGTFLTKVYDGPYKDMGKWIADMQAHVKGKGKETKKLYFCYTTCPACSKKFGHNYVVIMAMV